MLLYKHVKTWTCPFNQRTWITRLYCFAGMTPLWYTKTILEASRKLDWRKQKGSTSRTKGFCFSCHSDIDKEDFNILKWNSSILSSILLDWHIPLGNKTSLFRFWKCFNKRLKLYNVLSLLLKHFGFSKTIQQNTPMFQHYSWPCDNRWLVLSTVPFTMFLGSTVWTVSLFLCGILHTLSLTWWMFHVLLSNGWSVMGRWRIRSTLQKVHEGVKQWAGETTDRPVQSRPELYPWYLETARYQPAQLLPMKRPEGFLGQH